MTKRDSWTPQEYLALSLPERAEWVKSQVVEAIAAGKDIKNPILMALTIEARAVSYTGLGYAQKP